MGVARRKNASKAGMVDRDGIERPEGMAEGASFYYIQGSKLKSYLQEMHKQLRDVKNAGPEDGAAADEALSAME